MHGLIFFYIQKFAESLAERGATKPPLRTTVAAAATRFLPSKSYPDDQAVSLLSSLAESSGDDLGSLLEKFGGFLAPHLVKVAGQSIDPAWRTLDLIENTESVIHTMVRATTPEATPPVIQTARTAADEVQVIYASSRQLCRLAAGIMRGVATHYGEQVEVTQDACMLHGAPFCTFVVRLLQYETHDSHASHAETIELQPSGDGSFSSGDEIVVTGRAFEDPLPAMIGGHRIIRLLGQGGMGRVYLAHDERLGRDVAIKTMLPSRADDPSARKRFLRESRAAAKVEHQHVVMIHQVGEHPVPGLSHGLPYFVMQRLSGSSLTAVRQELGRLSLTESLRIAREIALGLQAAHEAGLVHRDIKPENVFLEGPHRRVKIIDFGLASDDGTEDVRITVDGTLIGTPAYMAPERLLHTRRTDFKADLFGLGVMLYELLSGSLPFEGNSVVSMLAAISRGSPVPLENRIPNLPAEVTNLVMRLLASDPDARPADAAAVASEIATIESRLAADESA
jgi:tRNA A-37 threonylcarbamoyl transferase component Bud32